MWRRLLRWWLSNEIAELISTARMLVELAELANLRGSESRNEIRSPVAFALELCGARTAMMLIIVEDPAAIR
jgi:hypothetical protein